jgi:subtilase family serine protease
VTASSLDVVSGGTVTVTFDVRNRGTTDVPLVPIQLADGASGRELARADIAVPAGQVRPATLAWRTGASGEIPLLVRVDPFDLLRETREDDDEVALALTVRPSSLPNLSVSGAEVAFAPDPRWKETRPTCRRSSATPVSCPRDPSPCASTWAILTGTAP